MNLPNTSSTEDKYVSRAHLHSQLLTFHQIKNAFSNAQTIARSEGLTRLTMDHLKVVLEALYDWKAATGS